MKVTISFETWYSQLISDQLWFELLRHYRDETIKKAGEKVFAGLVADETTDVRPMKENRKHVYNILIKSGPGDKPKPKPYLVVEAEKKEAEVKKDWVPVSEEERQRRLAEYKAMVDAMPKRWSPPEMSEEEKEREGVLRKKHEPFVRSEVETQQAVNEHRLKVREARRKYFLSAYPDAEELEIEAYINKFPDL